MRKEIDTTVGVEGAGVVLSFDVNANRSEFDVRFQKGSTPGEEFIKEGAWVAITGIVPAVNYPERKNVQEIDATKIQELRTKQ